MSKLYAGAGKAEICLPEVFAPNREGFTKRLDPLYVRVILLRGDDSASAAVVSLELTSLMSGSETLKERVRGITGAEHVWITVSHTFSAPHIGIADGQDAGPGVPGGPPPMSPEERAEQARQTEALLSAVDAAANQAVGSLSEAVMYSAYGRSTVNTGRDVETKDGWWLAEGSDAYADHTLPVVFFETPENAPIAVLYNFPVQSSVLDHAVMPDGGFAVSGDLAGRASAYLEEKYPVALFLCGAAGDQAPRQKASADLLQPDGTLRHMERGAEGIAIKNALGEELAAAVLAARIGAIQQTAAVRISSINRLFSVPAKVMPDRREISARKVPDYRENGTTQSNVELLRIGSLALIGVKPELSASIGALIRNGSPFPCTMVATMVNGGAKYMADREGFDHISYAAQNSPFGRGAAELLGQQALTMLNAMWDEP